MLQVRIFVQSILLTQGSHSVACAGGESLSWLLLRPGQYSSSSTLSHRLSHQPTQRPHTLLTVLTPTAIPDPAPDPHTPALGPLLGLCPLSQVTEALRVLGEAQAGPTLRLPPRIGKAGTPREQDLLSPPSKSSAANVMT